MAINSEARTGRPPIELDRAQERLLRQAVRRVHEFEAARDEVHQAVLDAWEAGVPQTRIAEATGLGRQTVIRWLRGSE